MEEVQNAKTSSTRMDAVTAANLAVCIETINNLGISKNNIVQIVQDSHNYMWTIIFYH